ncbi:hypothetical protein RFI_09240, partial [Reticulomyxa filosa]
MEFATEAGVDWKSQMEFMNVINANALRERSSVEEMKGVIGEPLGILNMQEREKTRALMSPGKTGGRGDLTVSAAVAVPVSIATSIGSMAIKPLGADDTIQILSSTLAEPPTPLNVKLFLDHHHEFLVTSAIQECQQA